MSTQAQTKKQEAEAKKAAEQKKAERNAQMSPTLRKYRVTYVDTVTHNGRKSKSCGDELSITMQAIEPERAAKIAEAVLGLEDGFLSEKYAKLNPGQIKMNSVNRIRAAIKREDVKLPQVKKAIRAIAS